MLRGTLDLGLSALPFVYGAFTLSRLPFQVIQLGLTSILPVLNPEKPELLGLGSALFRSPLLWASRLISLPPGT